MSEDVELTKKVKDLALELGADKVGIADATLAEDPPHGHGNPSAMLKDAKTAISIVIAYPDGAMGVDMIDDLIEGGCYVNTQHALNNELMHITLKLAKFLEKQGYKAVPLAPELPRDEKRWAGVISHRYIGQLAGVGEIGQSNLLLTPEWGPRVQLATVITNAPLVVDGPKLIDKVCKKCTTCVEKCPPRAIGAENYPPYNFNINRCFWGVMGWYRLTKVEEPPKDWIDARPTAMIMVPKYERQYPQIKEYQDLTSRVGWLPLCAECVIHCKVGIEAAEKRRSQ